MIRIRFVVFEPAGLLHQIRVGLGTLLLGSGSSVLEHLELGGWDVAEFPAFRDPPSSYFGSC